MRDKLLGKHEDKFLMTLYDKKHYIIHYHNLQCICHGLCVTKIHRVLQFAQSPWLREYIHSIQISELARKMISKKIFMI